MLAIELFEEFEGPPEPTLIDALRDFLPIAVKHLKLQALPKITFVKDVKDTHVPTFGRYNNDEKLIFVDIENRHPNDIIRTLAHELTHYAQGEHGKLDIDSWQTGSTVENDANAQAGVIMRKFNTKYPQYLKLKPVMFESIEGSESEAEEEQEREESDPTKPIPFPKGTTLVNVSDVYDWYKLGMAIPALDKADPRTFHKGVPHTVFAFGSEEEEHKMIPLLKRLGFSLHDIDTQDDYQKAIRASDVIEHLEQYVAENYAELDEKWSQKYKKSINCSNPKGFSQKAHCAGRKKHTNEAEDRCPPATQDIALNLKNRQKAINEYGYGPLNPLEPNVKFWAKKQQMWQLDSIDDAKKSLCGNCAAFDVSKDAIACIERGIGDDSGSENPHDVVEAGDLGYCRFLKFKCASLRTCDAWVVGGPITESKENKPVTIHTNPNYRGATIGAGVKEQLPITKMPIDQLQMWESDKTLRTKKVRDWVKNTLIPKLQDKGRLMPLIVWNRKGQHFVIDGNHRYLAYKAVKFQGDVPVQIVPNNMVTVTNKIPVEENFADGKGPGKPGDSQRHGIPKGATIAQLEKAAKAPGRKGQLARWQINMRRGRKK